MTAGGTHGGSQVRTILLLDDDSTTLMVLHAILEPLEARVIECDGERCAVRWSSELPEQIDLVVADVVLEGANGPAVVRKIEPWQPLMRRLFISGFSLEELQSRGLFSREEAQGGVEFLQKPFTAEHFLGQVSRLLARGFAA
jgi:response regulator RpfG family c-di-GMP phosphodiesterase